ncbi:hypothetical protein ACMYR3_01290 [Ampullimonas aquatilis]|uniref:hypothetical protein n=1 Tax=Ampullimonas aquatilis TaxID=1341549 RepID=UPI003C76F939
MNSLFYPTLLLCVMLLWLWRVAQHGRQQRKDLLYYGMRVARQSLELILLTQQHRGLINTQLKGQIDLHRDIEQRRKSIEEVLSHITHFLKENDCLRAIMEPADIDLYRQDWHALLKAIDSGLTASAAFKRHTVMITRPMNWLAQLGQHTQDLPATSLADKTRLNLVFHTLPILAELLAQIRGIGSGMVALGKSDVMERHQLLQLRKKALLLLATANTLPPDQIGKVHVFLSNVPNLWAEDPDKAITPLVYFAQATEAIDTVFAMIAGLLGEPDTVMQAEFSA